MTRPYVRHSRFVVGRDILNKSESFLISEAIIYTRALRHLEMYRRLMV